MGRKLHHQRAPLGSLVDALADTGPLWRRYALKTARFSEKAPPIVEISHIQPPHTIH
jgi:hypothetical protein